MNIIGIIPARMASSRFPGKPLAKICGMPMIGHVYHRSVMSKSLSAVYVATCDQEVVEYVNSIGGKAVMTKDTHERASDRCAEAMLKIEAETGEKIDLMVMIQGDEPLVLPEMIDEAVQPMIDDTNILITNLLGKITTIEEFEDPNEVKVVVDKFNNALYFSREPIPSRKKGVKDVSMYKQVCIIPFRRDFLLEYNETPQTPLEIIESVDMMRILENGLKVKMIPTRFDSKSVDTLDDLYVVEKIMNNDTLYNTYSKLYKDWGRRR
ncbi:MAG: 3-deoxy-manno-octulosonate cytidylyltransferase [Pseudomonadota bacterium]